MSGDDPNGSGLTIHLMHSDGRNLTVGPYDRVVAHLALAYAADGRPTTVTIIGAPPLVDRKILLRPALVDTEVGCHAIRLDQFVDRYGLARSSGWRQAPEVVGTQYLSELHRLAWLARWSASEESKVSRPNPVAVDQPGAGSAVVEEESETEVWNDHGAALPQRGKRCRRYANDGMSSTPSWSTFWRYASLAPTLTRASTPPSVSTAEPAKLARNWPHEPRPGTGCHRQGRLVAFGKEPTSWTRIFRSPRCREISGTRRCVSSR